MTVCTSVTVDEAVGLNLQSLKSANLGSERQGRNKTETKTNNVLYVTV